MQTVADLMTTKLLTLSANHSMKNVHDLITKKGIRHIPIMDEQNKHIIALVTQKVMVAKVVAILTAYGPQALLEKEMRTPVLDIAVKDFDKVPPNMPLKDAAAYFLQNKYGCLTVVDENNHLVGMLTSSDFVKLSFSLLQ
ncbi:MAG: CBS domain-containing protein [Glaciecola sp.]